MLGIINSTPSINYMVIIAMQGHRGNIRKCPCIARSVLSCHAIAHYSSPPLGSARSNRDGTHRRLFWPPYLRHLCNSTHQTFKTSPSTFNVYGDSPRIAIAAPIFSVFHIVSLTRETTKSGSATTLTACHSSNTASATATLPPTPCDCITEAFLTDSG